MKTVDPLHGVLAFLAVARRESFTAAAEDLGLSRATVSAQVADLERRLAVRLFHRSTRLVRLTPAGEAYRAHLADLETRVATAERAARAEHGAPEGRLRLTAPPDFAHRFLVPWATEFLAGHPGIEIEMDVSSETRHLIEGRFDLAVRGVIEVAPNLITRALGQSRFYTCAAPGYLARAGAPAVPADLARHDLLHFSPLRRGRIWTMTRGDEVVEVPIAPRLALPDGTGLMRAALMGGGICQLPAFVVGDEIRAGRLVEVLADWSAGAVPLHAVYPDNRLIAARVRAFVGFLARKAAAEPDLRREIGGA
ncbi:LysR family transcriptional regulator [Frigidibacter sp. MR17.24]|uniref:LysR family transcriptional regulator n=1 Tax=Frigidibacter sp. MR17.24 TaxID=3127345 RepID=UPI0030130C7F